MKQSQVDSQPKRNKDGSIRKKPGRKPKAEVLHTMSFPSFSLRQTNIILNAIEDMVPLIPNYIVDDEPVTAEELVGICQAMVRGFK